MCSTYYNSSFRNSSEKINLGHGWGLKRNNSENGKANVNYHMEHGTKGKAKIDIWAADMANAMGYINLFVDFILRLVLSCIKGNRYFSRVHIFYPFQEFWCIY